MKQIRTTIAMILGVSMVTLMRCGGAGPEAETPMPNQPNTLGSERIETAAPDPAETDDGTAFTSGAGHFSIHFPDTPAISSENFPSAIGNIEITTYLYEKSASEAFTVAYSDYPAQLVNESNVDSLLQAGKQHLLVSLEIPDAEKEEKISLDDNKGIFFQGNNGKFHVVCEMYMVSNRLYQISILRDGSYPSEEEIGRFFRSFKLEK